MLDSLKTLLKGVEARAGESLRDQYSIELIDQKIREAKDSLKTAKQALASIIQRERAERRQIEALQARVDQLTKQAKAALKEDRNDLASEAAAAIADMENELVIRRETLARLETRVLQLRQSGEKTNRRIIDLHQGAVAARAVRQEQEMQRRLNRHIGGSNAIDEAQELISRILQRDDPLEQAEILNEIDDSLSRNDIAERMAEAGFGKPSKTTATDVLARLKS